MGLNVNKVIRVELTPSQYDRLVEYATERFEDDPRRVNKAIVGLLDKYYREGRIVRHHRRGLNRIVRRVKWQV